MLQQKRPKKSINITQDINPQNAKSYDIKDLIEKHIEPEVWQKHIENDLMKFWGHPDARKMRNGLFPTYRSNKGEIFGEGEENQPPEIKAALKDEGTKGLVDLDYDYVRTHSRQTYAYGIAFNVTGNPEYLKWCKQGAKALMNAFDGENGMFTKQHKSGKWGDLINERDAQNLAYGLSGLGMYYYLTHDEETLFKIMQAKKYIFDNYFSHGRGYITWLPKTAKSQTDDRVEIVAQLDQIYAYMIWLSPALPEPYQSDWKEDLKKLTKIIITRFYSERYGFFWGTGTNNAAKQLGTDHTDFGHSIKTMWLIHQVGIMTGEIAFINFSKEKMDNILQLAYIDDTGSWARRYNEDGSLDKDKEWWSFAELNQAASILALNDPSYLSYLNNTYDYWFKHMVDKEYGEIHHYVFADTNKPDLKFPKIHAWKTSLHSFEHALMGYLTTSQIKNKTSTLYYAFKSEDEVTFDRVHPYLFKANMVDIRRGKKLDFMENENKIIEVDFYALH